MKSIIDVSAVGISCFLLFGTSFPLELRESGVEQEAKMVNKGEQDGNMDQDQLRKNDSNTKKPMNPPPLHDPGMVIQPDFPPDPDAVIIPPPIDPDMAVDPVTREPMTREELENLNKNDQSDESSPDRREREGSRD